MGKNVEISPYTVIYDDVIIGDNTKIHSNVAIYPGTKIGSNCEVYPGAVIGAIPQDLKFEGEITNVEIGDNTIIRECVTIHRATKDKWVTRIGSNCLLMAYVHVAHDCQIGNGVILASICWTFRTLHYRRLCDLRRFCCCSAVYENRKVCICDGSDIGKKGCSSLC